MCFFFLFCAICYFLLFLWSRFLDNTQQYPTYSDTTSIKVTGYEFSFSNKVMGNLVLTSLLSSVVLCIKWILFVPKWLDKKDQCKLGLHCIFPNFNLRPRSGTAYDLGWIMHNFHNQYQLVSTNPLCINLGPWMRIVH